MTQGWLALSDVAATERVGATLADRLQAGDVVTLSGPLGAGKSTLARAVLSRLGLMGEAPSPSFALVIAYAPPEVRLPLWHVDLYRLDDPADVEELGLDDARADAALLVEWPERAGSDPWPDALALSLHPLEDDARRLTWTAPAAWEARWPPPARP